MNKLRYIFDQFFVKWFWYGKIKGYNYRIVKCPVCGHLTINDYSICPTCGWEYDGIVNENEESYVNGSTIAEYRMRVIGKYGEKIIKKHMGDK